MVELYKFQKTAIEDLLGSKHFAILGTGCLAGDTPVPMSDGGYKLVKDMKGGDVILSYDEDNNEFVENIVGKVTRTCHKPKPMIELEYDGEKITTTYDHPFFNGEGYYPLYQLVWGALETSQRTQLKLLCEQYGTPFNDKAIWCKHCSSNEAVKGREWLLQNNDGWKNSEVTQDCSRKLVEEPRKIAMCESPKWRQIRQQGRKPRMVFDKIQHLVWLQQREHKTTAVVQQRENTYGRGEKVFEELLRKKYEGPSKLCKSKTLQHPAKEVSKSSKDNNNALGNWKAKIKDAEPYYTISMCKAPYTYCIGRKHYYLTHNCGKTAVALNWMAETAENTKLKKVCVWTTASKSHTTDWQDEKEIFVPKCMLDKFEVISWNKAADWTKQHADELDEYIFILDEIQRSKAGVSSGMGKAFLRVASKTNNWIGLTATPGDNWLHFYPYFTACGYVKHKTEFLRRFAITQTFKGFPEIVGWTNEDVLKKWWDAISTAPDTSQMYKELPKETHTVVDFKKPKGYDEVKKTRMLNGEFLDTTMGLCHALREMSFTKEKQQWIKDFIEGLGTNAVLFYNYIEEGNKLEEIIKEARKEAKVWRIDGKHHDIPKAEQIGKYDIVLCQWQSGAESLNLQFINYWVSVTPTYSYMTSVQARGRIKRIGQKKPMFFYYMRCAGIESDVYKALKNKKDFSDEVYINGGK